MSLGIALPLYFPVSCARLQASESNSCAKYLSLKIPSRYFLSCLCLYRCQILRNQQSITYVSSAQCTSLLDPVAHCPDSALYRVKKTGKCEDRIVLLGRVYRIVFSSVVRIWFRCLPTRPSLLSILPPSLSYHLTHGSKCSSAAAARLHLPSYIAAQGHSGTHSPAAAAADAHPAPGSPSHTQSQPRQHSSKPAAQAGSTPVLSLASPRCCWYTVS